MERAGGLRNLGEALGQKEGGGVEIVMLSGGVGGARLARGLAAVGSVTLTVIVNVGDDDRIYGLPVSPDLDTVVYTLAGIEGPEGWGISDDSFNVIESLGDFHIDTRFRLGDGDLATNLYRSISLSNGIPLSTVTAEIARVLDVRTRILPATDDPMHTEVHTTDGVWRRFQEYFVLRQHQDEVDDVRFEGAQEASPAPGVLDAIGEAGTVIIGPSNPPLSIWPILAVPGIADAVAQARRVLAVSPLFGRRALKGPAHRVMRGLGLPVGNQGVAAAYAGLLTDLVIDRADANERAQLTSGGLTVHVADTHIADREAARSFAHWLLDLL